MQPFITSVIRERIRDFFVDARYKSTFTYLLTYLLTYWQWWRHHLPASVIIVCWTNEKLAEQIGGRMWSGLGFCSCNSGGKIYCVQFEATSAIWLCNPLMGTLKPPSNGPLYSKTVIGTLAVDGWTVTVATARRGLGGLRPAQSPVPSSLYQM